MRLTFRVAPFLRRIAQLKARQFAILVLVGGAAPALAASVAADPIADRAATDIWRQAEEASARGDCETASTLYRQVLATEPLTAKRIAATHALALCVADPDEPWAARELMADLLPEVLRHFGPQSAGLARHHAIWAEAEVRSGALNVAWRRSEAAISAARAAGEIDPFDHAAELYRLAAIQLARGEGDAFLAFLSLEFERLQLARWAATGDGELFMEVIGDVPSPGDAAALAAWTRMGLEEFDPRPLYLSLVENSPA